jgi:phosphate transport system protein
MTQLPSQPPGRPGKPGPNAADATPMPREHVRSAFDRDLAALRRRLIREATIVIDMLETALRGLWDLDTELAREVRAGEERIDREEVSIEHECFRLLTLQQPFGADFRLITFCMRVNVDLERVADHASSIAKVTIRLRDAGIRPRWPTALVELGERLPGLCHDLLRAVLDEDAEAAKRLVAADKVLDALDKRLFSELVEQIREAPSDATAALHMHRLGRELERAGDLMVNIAEDLVYLVTGEIARHNKKRWLAEFRAQQQG